MMIGHIKPESLHSIISIEEHIQRARNRFPITNAKLTTEHPNVLN